MLEEQEAAFRQAHVGQRYNLRILNEHWHAKEQIIGTFIMANMDE